MPEWFLPVRGSARAPGAAVVSVLRTEVADAAGSVVVETRCRGRSDVTTSEELAEYHRLLGEWETTICPADTADPDDPSACVFAVCDTWAEAEVAHQQAIGFASAALRATARPGRPPFGRASDRDR